MTQGNGNYFFTTYDNNLTRVPLGVDSDDENGELKKIDSDYRSDYVLFVDGTGLFNWGDYKLNLSSLDNNNNGFSDIVESELPASINFSGTWQSKFGNTGNVIDGSFTRSSGQNAGIYSATLTDTFVGTIIISGDLFVSSVTGSVQYDPETMQMDFDFEITFDKVFGYTGTTSYQVANQNTVTTSTMMLTRSDWMGFSVPSRTVFGFS